MNPFEPNAEPREGPGNGSVSAASALEGLAIAGAQRLSSVRLTSVVAATLRAAIDLVLGEHPSRPLTVAWDDGALEITLPELRLDHLTAAASLLETIDGSLGAAREGRSFLMRVPVAGPRSMYLMLEQATLGIAIPWHSVMRIRLIEPQALEALARREGCPVLPPFVTAPSTHVERPAVLVALGLRRAFLVADRLVWRMPATPAEDEGMPPGASLGPAVRNAEGEVFWVVDPARLLKGVDPAPMPAISTPPRPTVKAPSEPPIERPEPLRTAPAEPAMIELRPEDVEPLRDPEPSPPPARPMRPGRRALVVEDSIVGRIFLQRLLESQGFSVEAASNATQLRHILGAARWDILFVDVALPDSPRGDHLRTLSGANAVALVRDAHDEKLATQAGVRLSLRKPFERGDLLRVVEALGLQGETA